MSRVPKAPQGSSIDGKMALAVTDGDRILRSITVQELIDEVIAQIPASELPVGYTVITTIATNPATSLGYGTWVQTARGRAILGEGTSDAAYAAGATGGASNHTLDMTEIPAHNHGGGDHIHRFKYLNRSESGSNQACVGSLNQGNSNKNVLSSGTIIDTEGGGGAHNNLMPYEVFYVWERTA